MNPEEVIRQIWAGNAFMKLLNISIKEIHCGGVTLEMELDLDKHTNHWLGVHGGALASLADSVTGLSCATVGKVGTTLSLHIDNISNVPGMGKLIAKSEVVHNGQSTINLAAEIRDEATDKLISKISCIMFVMDKLQGVPEKW